MNRLEARDLYRFYHTPESETLALQGVSLALAPGELVAVMGPSGSGKSTLLACLAGLDTPDGGVVLIDGQPMRRRPEAERAALRASALGILLQHGSLFAHLSVAENLHLQLRLGGQTETHRIATMLERVGLAHRRNAFPAHLSGGEATRAGLAIALVTMPPVLLADEPTAEVDATTEEAVLAVFEQHRRDGGAALIVTHSETLANRMDRVISLRDGKIV